MNNKVNETNLYSELPEEQVKEMLEMEKRYKKCWLLLYILIFLALLFLGIGVIYYFYTVNSFEGGKIQVNDLFVVHSSGEFGSNVVNFDNYTSYDTAFSYTFYVDSQNNIEVPYKVSLVDVENTLSDKTKVGYAILKNEEVVFQGTLLDNYENVLTTTKINAGTVDNYELKLWKTDKLSGSYKFKINVSI